MAQTPSTLSQPCLSISAQVAANSVIEVRDGNEVLFSVTTPKNAQSLIFSSDKLKVGTDYGIYAGGNLITTVTAEEGVSGNGGMGGGFGGHGGFGGGQGGSPGGFGGRGDRPEGGRFPGEGAI